MGSVTGWLPVLSGDQFSKSLAMVMCVALPHLSKGARPDSTAPRASAVWSVAMATTTSLIRARSVGRLRIYIKKQHRCDGKLHSELVFEPTNDYTSAGLITEGRGHF